MKVTMRAAVTLRRAASVPLWLAATCLLGGLGPLSSHKAAAPALVPAKSDAATQQGAAAASGPAAQPGPMAQPGPVAQIRPVAEQYGHTTLIDNYRWMEGAAGPEFAEYLRAQSDAAEAALARIGGRERIRKKIAALQNTGVSIAAVVPEGDTVFYLKRGPADDVARLMVRSADGGGDRVLVDPETLPGVKPHSEITQFAPSQDGSHVEYALGAPGSDRVELHVLDVGLRQTLPEKVAASRFAGVAWRRDSKGFYYTKPEVAGAAPVLSVYLHMLRSDPGEDALILSGNHLPFVFRGAHAIPHLIIPPSSDYALAVVSDGISPDVAVYETPLAQLDDQPAPWQSIATQDDGVVAVAPSYSIAFMLTHSKAPRMRVVSEDMAEPGFTNARTVVPESAGAITAIAAASDALFVTRRQGATMHLLRLDYNDSQPQDVLLPYLGSIAIGSAASPGGLVADARSPGVLFSLQGWVHPQSWFRYDAKLHRVVDLGIAPSTAPGGYDDIETVARAADGTDVPLSIIARHGVALDHARPALVEAYGSYGFPFDPRFVPGALAWADEGGVYAIAHVRGGGEGGEVWHAAGRLQHKETSFSDLLSCVTALEKAGYSDPAHVTAVGTTAGAVTVANAMIRSPAAFRAVAMHDGLLNPLRAGTYGGGSMAVMEFGSARDPAQFPALLAADAFSQVKDGVEYPAVLLDVSPSAAPVPVWQSAKMAARLQAATTSARPVYLHISANAEADRLTFLLWQTGVSGFQPGAAAGPAAAKHGKGHKGLRASR